MLTPEKIEAIKNQAAKELGYKDYDDYFQYDNLFEQEDKTLQFFHRCMELCYREAMDDVRNGLPTELEIDVMYAEEYNRADGNMDKSRSYRAFKKGIEKLSDKIRNH